MSCPDDFEFLLGVPTLAEVWQQHARLLEEECHELREEVRALKAERRKLVQLYARSQKELGESQRRAEELQRELNRKSVEYTLLHNRIAYPYSYGDHAAMTKERLSKLESNN
ncbi:hypothetical protein [Stutzerimonas nitrititolerans]|uniref:hypothetical protein n=1 Tax=Stutzerimonas nitrititolerans TaxID=2482751 RepID=UPI0028B1CE75|nr:hypothetical protein [Stutzerimonas nitrititolerans]